MITYEQIPQNKDKNITVKLDGKMVGTIRRHAGTGCYFYNPKGQPIKRAGELFKSVAEVKASIEGDA